MLDFSLIYLHLSIFYYFLFNNMTQHWLLFVFLIFWARSKFRGPWCRKDEKSDLLYMHNIVISLVLRISLKYDVCCMLSGKSFWLRLVKDYHEDEVWLTRYDYLLFVSHKFCNNNHWLSCLVRSRQMTIKHEGGCLTTWYLWFEYLILF